MLSRGGHDYRKVYAAFKAATEHVGQPTVILAQTVKGWTIDALEGKNATHQMKKLTTKDLKAFRDRLYLEITDASLEDAYNPPYYHPGNDSDEIVYLQERRQALGGYLPERRVKPTIIKLPGDEVYAPLMESAGEKTKVATTQAFVRLLRDLMRDKEIGHRIVPIAPDEFRTFGMDSMFPTAKIYNPHGQTYESVDRKLSAVLQGIRAGPAAARGHLRGRRDGLDDRCRLRVRHAWRADDPVLHLLLDVRLPAHRRLDLGDGRPVGAGLPARRNRGPDRP